MSDINSAVAYLRSPAAIRERSLGLFGHVESDSSRYFRLHLDQLDRVADLVLGVMKENYPSLSVPLHSRWRHFNQAQFRAFSDVLGRLKEDDRIMAKLELAMTSVLLDAGAGDAWRFDDPLSGRTLSRSEGLAAASLSMFLDGRFSCDNQFHLRATSVGLKHVTKEKLEEAFQVSDRNPLLAVEGRLGLLHRLGETVESKPDYFGGTPPRLGGILGRIRAECENECITSSKLLHIILSALAPIWPGRVELGGENLGDVWRHPALKTADETSELIPFHKLSQWLTYSLIEPLEEGGVRVVNRDEMTGLAEYRNGGLILDGGLVSLKNPEDAEVEHAPDSEIIVEWRALTIVFLDRIAEKIRTKLGRTPETFPLGNILEGGTWAAGRKLARDRREGGGPPLKLRSDGTVF